jgi:hypothetical protein
MFDGWPTLMKLAPPGPEVPLAQAGAGLAELLRCRTEVLERARTFAPRHTICTAVASDEVFTVRT